MWKAKFRDASALIGTNGIHTALWTNAIFQTFINVLEWKLRMRFLFSKRNLTWFLYLTFLFFSVEAESFRTYTSWTIFQHMTTCIGWTFKCWTSIFLLRNTSIITICTIWKYEIQKLIEKIWFFLWKWMNLNFTTISLIIGAIRDSITQPRLRNTLTVRAHKFIWSTCSSQRFTYIF